MLLYVAVIVLVCVFLVLLIRHFKNKMIKAELERASLSRPAGGKIEFSAEDNDMKDGEIVISLAKLLSGGKRKAPLAQKQNDGTVTAESAGTARTKKRKSPARKRGRKPKAASTKKPRKKKESSKRTKPRKRK
ncbi:MAG: hypothetical protein GXO64_04875 [Candidatus Micrarchaeota archaeon]|nr:hypothetical protein [Candidatus Micrarchaeota archaeon]